MPLRSAMNHLGHKSKAIHKGYARHAKVVTLPLEHYEQLKAEKILQFQQELDQSKPPEAEGDVQPGASNG